MHTKSHKDWFRHSKVDKGDLYKPSFIFSKEGKYAKNVE
jgi:hypothetical protein